MDNIKSQTTALQIPLYSPIPDVALPPHARELLQQNYDELLLKFKSGAQEEARDNTTYHINSTRHHDNYEKLKAITPNILDEIFAYLNGAAKMPKIDFDNSNLLFRDDMFLLTLYQDRLQTQPECNLWHLLRAYCLEQPKQLKQNFYSLLEEEILLQQADLRQVADILVKITEDNHARQYIASAFLADFTLPMYHIYRSGKEDKIWLFFAENQQHSYKSANALAILDLFPVLPEKYIPYLLEQALGEGRRLRLAAQKILSKVPNIHLEAEKSLLSTKQEILIVAANWLADLGQSSSIQIVKTTLADEKKEPVWASLLSALSRLGEDISHYLSKNTVTCGG